jgi:hypothetical protein
MRRLENVMDEVMNDPLAELPKLAERLGVKEWDDDGATILLTTKTGKNYCVFQLVNAMLDRMDQILPLTRQ